MTRHVMIVAKRGNFVCNWMARKVLRRIKPSDIYLFEDAARAAKENANATSHGYMATIIEVYDGLPELQQHLTECYQHFLRFRADANRLTGYLGANFRSELSDKPNPVDQAIALLEQMKKHSHVNAVVSDGLGDSEGST